jgi:hypothetical protein
MSAALQIEETARERLLENLLDQLEPLYATIYEDEPERARLAAYDALEPYLRDDRADLAVAAQIIACGLASMRILTQCMNPGIKSDELARLVRTVDMLGRTEQRHRKTGLYPAAPKPEPEKRAPAKRVPAKEAPAEGAPELEAAPPEDMETDRETDTAIPLPPPGIEVAQRKVHASSAGAEREFPRLGEAAAARLDGIGHAPGGGLTRPPGP